jgi:hypothetical protein
VQINHAKNAIVLVLQGNPLLDRAEIISQMNVAGGPNPGKNSHNNFQFSKSNFQ